MSKRKLGGAVLAPDLLQHLIPFGIDRGNIHTAIGNMWRDARLLGRGRKALLKPMTFSLETEF